MGTLIVHPGTKEQLAAIKAFMKSLKIPFEVQKDGYAPEFVAKVKERREQIKNG